MFFITNVEYVCYKSYKFTYANIVTQSYTTYFGKQRICWHDKMTCPTKKHHAQNNCDYSEKTCYLKSYE